MARYVSILVDTKAAQEEARRIVEGWSDPENQPPKGFGCWMCHLERPVVWLDHTALGFHCFAQWFPGWDDAKVADWLIAQVERAAAWEQGREARKEKDKAGLARWLGNHKQEAGNER